MHMKPLALPTSGDKSTHTIARRSATCFLPRRVLGVACTGLLGVFTIVAPRPYAVCGAQRVTTHLAPPVGRIKTTSAPIVAVNNKATLPDGATVEFVGISDFKTLPGSKSYHWWKPDGSPVTDAPSSSRLLSQYLRQGMPINNNIREQPNRDFVLDTNGLDLNETDTQIDFAPISNQYGSSGFTGRELRPNKAWRYDNVSRFSDLNDLHGIKTLHLRLSRGAWHTCASTTKLPTIVSIDAGTTVTFLHPNKRWMEASRMWIADFPYTQSVGVQFRSDRFERMETRLVGIDDKGHSVEFQQITHIGDDNNFALAIALPKQPMNHIKAYQLQARPYQYVDFPNIHFEPTKP